MPIYEMTSTQRAATGCYARSPMGGFGERPTAESSLHEKIPMRQPAGGGRLETVAATDGTRVAGSGRSTGGRARRLFGLFALTAASTAAVLQSRKSLISVDRDQLLNTQGRLGSAVPEEEADTAPTPYLRSSHQAQAGCPIPNSFGGWHEGRIVDEITSQQGLTWKQCAAACAVNDACEFWTLRIHDYKSCVLLSDKGAYHASGMHVEGDKHTGCADLNAPSEGQDIARIFYINLDKNVKRREQIEAHLSRQDLRDVAVSRVSALAGGPEDTCRTIVGGPNKCRGVAGLALTNIQILEKFDHQKGLTLVLEDDVYFSDLGILMASIEKVPSDWDVIRWNCDLIMPMPSTYQDTNEYVFRTNHATNCTATADNAWCNYYGGTFATLYRGSSVEPLKEIWSERPFFDVDGALNSPNIKSYCVRIGDATVSHRPPASEVTDIQLN